MENTSKEADAIKQFSEDQMDLIMWYDIDHGSSINDRSDSGWLPLNPEYPNAPVTGHCRTTTSLLGKYDCQDLTIIKQHAYWIKAIGCNVIASDLTNTRSTKELNIEPDMMYFYKGINNAFKLQIQQLAEITEFDAPKAYPTLRLGDTTFDNLQLLLDDMYDIYLKYPSKWYKLYDLTTNKDKPFVVIFADGGVLNDWVNKGIPFDDGRFNIRWSNGFLMYQPDITEIDSCNNVRIANNMPYWLFIENTEQVGRKGYYQPIYKMLPGNDGIEQMITWASVHLGGYNWDGMLDEIDGKMPFERYSQPVYKLKPKTLLVNRFNYPLAWIEEPQEGISRNKSTHVEPNVDWGFLVFNNVANELYKVRGYIKKAPEKPVLNVYDKVKKVLEIKLDNYPLEYRISNNEDMRYSEWIFLNVGSGGIKLDCEIDTSIKLYIQSRNSFGESPVGELTLEQ